MIMSVSTLSMGRGAAMALRLVKGCMLSPSGKAECLGGALDHVLELVMDALGFAGALHLDRHDKLFRGNILLCFPQAGHQLFELDAYFAQFLHHLFGLA